MESLLRPSRARLLLFAAFFLVHLGVSVVATVEVGYLGIFEAALANWGAAQVFSDLGAALAIALVWVVADARARGRAAWPYVPLTLALGSFVPLGYLVARELTLLQAERSPTGGAPRVV